VEGFSAVVCLLVPTNKPTTAENTSTSTFIQKPEDTTAVWRAPDDGHCNARNMLSNLYDKGIKFYDWLLHLVGCFEWLKLHGTTTSPPPKCVLIFSTTFVWYIYHFNKYWARYDKQCILVFM
jgi:hypothetical protein